MLMTDGSFANRRVAVLVRGRSHGAVAMEWMHISSGVTSPKARASPSRRAAISTEGGHPRSRYVMALGDTIMEARFFVL